MTRFQGMVPPGNPPDQLRHGFIPYRGYLPQRSEGPVQPGMTPELPSMKQAVPGVMDMIRMYKESNIPFTIQVGPDGQLWILPGAEA